MDNNPIAGTARNVAGKAQKAFGRAPDTKPEAEGAIGWLGGRGSHRPL
jgi:uncharacterized protein YjbJ (UPF0337 family)